MKPDKRSDGKWQMDVHGRFDNRSIAEMIVTSLFYAKPPVIAEADYDRVVSIVEEELIVIDSHGEEWQKRKQDAAANQASQVTARKLADPER